MKLQLKVGSRYFKFISASNSRDVVVDGVNSLVRKGKEWHENHIPMIDYDDAISLENLIAETKRLQKKFKLGNAWIFESSYHHYHVVYFEDVLDYFDCLRILHDTPCCRQYKMWRMLRQNMTLRMSSKDGSRPKFAFMVKKLRNDSKKVLFKEDQQLIYNYVMNYGKD